MKLKFSTLAVMGLVSWSVTAASPQTEDCPAATLSKQNQELLSVDQKKSKSVQTIETCKTIQLEAYCDIQTTAFDSIYERTETYEYDESFTHLVTELEKSSDSSSSGSTSVGIGFKGLSFSGDSKTKRTLKTHFKEAFEIVSADKHIYNNENEVKQTFQSGVYQYFRVVTATLIVDGEYYETVAKQFVYSSPNHNEYESVLNRYCPKYMRRHFKTTNNAVEYDSGEETFCKSENIPTHHGFRVCFKEIEGSSQCQGHRHTCSGWSSQPKWTLPFRDDTDERGGGCTYQWRIESLVPQPKQEYRLCFKEVEGSSQCQGNRNSCSGWTTSPTWTSRFRDDTDNRGGGCKYIWKVEQRASTAITETPFCRICFRETEGSSQCQRNRNTCSGWTGTSNPAWSSPFRDDTDERGGGCYYEWYLDCVQPYAKHTCSGSVPCI